ncbi:MAG: RsmD family RNA methyltransferase, partial [Paracoccaceae bacterium]
RGAAQVTFVDDGAKAITLMRKNIVICRAAESTQVLRRDALRLGERRGLPFDLMFIDPPYGKGLGEKAMVAARDHGWLSNTALVLLEEGKEIPAPAGFRRLARRRYGDTFVLIFEPDTEQ